MPEASIYIVRHGLTAENLQHVLLGRTDPPLHRLGILQVEAAAAALSSISLENIYSSSLVRAMQTADIIAAAQSTPPPVHAVPEFQEIHFGRLDGWKSLTAYETHKEIMDIALADDAPDDFAFPDGERRIDALERFDRAIMQIAFSALGPTAIVSHGAVIGFWLSKISGNPIGQFRIYQPLHASITQVRFRGDQIDIVSFGQTAHITAELTEEIASARRLAVEGG